MSATVNTQARVDLLSLLKSLFRGMQLPYLKGGSRRFGYHSEASDTDFIVLCEDDESYRCLLRDLSEIGFSASSNPRYWGEHNYSGMEGLTCLLESHQASIHVMILREKKHYEIAREKHEQVDALLAEQPYLREVARALRREGWRGSRTFLFFVRLASASRP